MANEKTYNYALADRSNPVQRNVTNSDTPLSTPQTGTLPTWDGSRAVTSVVVDGPLKDLEQNKYKPSMLSYPKDLGSAAKGHMIQFDIRDVDPVTISMEEFKSSLSAVQTGYDVGYNSVMGGESIYSLSGAAKAPEATLKGIQGAAEGLKASPVGQKITPVLENMVKGEGQIKLNAPLTKDIIDSIRLYMPDTMNFSYNAQYDKLSLAEAINSVPLVAKVSNAITSILNNNAVKLASQSIGYVFNPQQQMLFEGIDFREFELEFTFTPTSPAETAAVNNIIKKLRRAAAPTINEASKGFFFTPPSVFNISFLYNGDVNTNIQQTRPCVLQAITVNYAPNGWSALSDGAPVQTVVSLSFKEIELVDRKSIEDEL
jgi:hypothetical protein